MTQQFETWRRDALIRAKIKTATCTDKEKEKLKLDYPERVIEKIPGFLSTPEEYDRFKIDVEQLITALSGYRDTKSPEYKNYLKLVGQAEADYKIRYNVIAKGSMIAMWMSLGIAIGVAFGVAFKNLALGIPLGIGIGLAIGGGMEQKAAKENRIL